MELLITNIVLMSYFIVSIYQGIRYRDQMTDDAFHHFISHIYLAGFLFVGINMLFFYSTAVPLMLSIFYILQHIVKENKRLLKTNSWRKDRRCSTNYTLLR